jgi:hypothetical protein
LEARLEQQAQCILVIIGATPEGKKELVGFTVALIILRVHGRTTKRSTRCFRR